MRVSFPPTYPDAAPSLRLSIERGLDDKLLGEAQGVMAAAAADNAGAPCVYAVAERVREWLVEHNEPFGGGSAYEEMIRRQKAKESKVGTGTAAGGGGGGAAPASGYAKEHDPSIERKAVVSVADTDEATRRRREGTPVTRDTFLAWRAAFEREQAAAAKAAEDRCVARVSAFSIWLLTTIVSAAAWWIRLPCQRRRRGD